MPEDSARRGPSLLHLLRCAHGRPAGPHPLRRALPADRPARCAAAAAEDARSFEVGDLRRGRDGRGSAGVPARGAVLDRALEHPAASERRTAGLVVGEDSAPGPRRRGDHRGDGRGGSVGVHAHDIGGRARSRDAANARGVPGGGDLCPGAAPVHADRDRDVDADPATDAATAAEDAAAAPSSLDGLTDPTAAASTSAAASALGGPAAAERELQRVAERDEPSMLGRQDVPDLRPSSPANGRMRQLAGRLPPGEAPPARPLPS